MKAPIEPRYKTVARGVQVYVCQDDSRSYRVNLMVRGRQHIQKVPENVFAQLEKQLGRPTTEEEEILECQRLRVRLRGLITGGDSHTVAWQRVFGPSRSGTLFREFALEVYVPDRDGEFANNNWKYAVGRLVEVFGSQPVSDINYDDIKTFVNTLKKGSYSASRIRDYIWQLSGIFRLAVRKGLRQDNPTHCDDKKEHEAIWPSDHASQRARKYVRAEEVDTLLQAAMMIETDSRLVTYSEEVHWRRRDTRWLAPIIRIAFETGMRRAEILGLSWERVFLDASVEHPYGYIRLENVDTKTRRGRAVPLSPIAAQVLKDQYKMRGGLDPVFVGRTGRANPDIRKAWAEVLHKAHILDLDLSVERLSGLHFHDLRASWAVDSLGNGAHLLQVKEAGGWISVTAMQRYLRCVNDDMASLHQAYERRTERQRVPR